MADSEIPKRQLYTGGYLFLGYGIGAVVGLITFVVAYIYCIVTYGFLLGLGLGWIPSLILAAILGWTTVLFWGLAVLMLLAVIGWLMWLFPQHLIVLVFALIIAVPSIWAAERLQKRYKPNSQDSV